MSPFGGRILVVDDNVQVLSIMSEFLASSFIVDIAPNAAAALKLVAATPPDAILLDVNMPGTDGVSLLMSLRRLGVTVPVFMMTGYDAPGLGDKVRQARCDLPVPRSRALDRASRALVAPPVRTRPVDASPRCSHHLQRGNTVHNVRHDDQTTVKAKIKNTGTRTASNIGWTIDVAAPPAGSAGSSGTLGSATIASLAPGAETEVSAPWAAKRGSQTLGAYLTLAGNTAPTARQTAVKTVTILPRLVLKNLDYEKVMVGGGRDEATIATNSCRQGIEPLNPLDAGASIGFTLKNDWKVKSTSVQTVAGTASFFSWVNRAVGQPWTNVKFRLSIPPGTGTRGIRVRTSTIIEGPSDLDPYD